MYISGPSLGGHSTEATLSNVATYFWPYYYKCIYFSLSPKATSLMWPKFLANRVALLEGDYCTSYLWTSSRPWLRMWIFSMTGRTFFSFCRSSSLGKGCHMTYSSIAVCHAWLPWYTMAPWRPEGEGCSHRKSIGKKLSVRWYQRVSWKNNKLGLKKIYNLIGCKYYQDQLSVLLYNSYFKKI